MIKEVIKCNKCDERGMITEVKNGAHYGHSCDCGYDNYLMKKRFEGVSIESLLEYAGKRIEQKGGKNPFAVNLGKLGGKSNSLLKVNASKENGKKGGRPKKIITPPSNKGGD